jgi:hypothetical protein
MQKVVLRRIYAEVFKLFVSYFNFKELQLFHRVGLLHLLGRDIRHHAAFLELREVTTTDIHT